MQISRLYYFGLKGIRLTIVISVRINYLSWLSPIFGSHFKVSFSDDLFALFGGLDYGVGAISVKIGCV